MAVSHEEIVGADHGIFLQFRGAMNRDVLTKNVAFADTQARRLIFVF